MANDDEISALLARVEVKYDLFTIKGFLRIADALVVHGHPKDRIIAALLVHFGYDQGYCDSLAVDDLILDLVDIISGIKGTVAAYQARRAARGLMIQVALRLPRNVRAIVVLVMSIWEVIDGFVGFVGLFTDRLAGFLSFKKVRDRLCGKKPEYPNLPPPL